MLDGERGEAARLAMRIVADLAGVMEADRLIDVASAHVDGCLYHGPAGLEFAERLVAGGAAVSVPTRSEERRVGKECRSRGSPYQEKEKNETVAFGAGTQTDAVRNRTQTRFGGA